MHFNYLPNWALSIRKVPDSGFDIKCIKRANYH
ncbi:Uncharacterised protein [Vibrio cholerae]|nr:Uncharacterised protein [Vibrio cholerae]